MPKAAPPPPPVADPDLAHIAEPLRHLAVPIGSLVADAANARRHDEKNLAAIKASPEFEDAKMSSLGQDTFCTPAIADGKLVVRGSKDLFCYGAKK